MNFILRRNGTVSVSGKNQLPGFQYQCKNIAFFKNIGSVTQSKELEELNEYNFFVQLVSTSSVCTSFELRQACVFICLHFRFQRTLFKKLHRFKKQLKHSK